MPGSDKVIANLDAWAQQLRARLLALAQSTAQSMEADAKATAPWEDETGGARRSIRGAASDEGDRIVAAVGMPNPKGLWLETGTGPRGTETNYRQHFPGSPPYSPEKIIYPKRAPMLSWVDKEGVRHFARHVRWRGMAPRRVLIPVRDRHAPAFFAEARRLVQG